MRWTYTLARNPGNIKALDWYKDNGLKVMGATAAQNVSMLLPLDDRVNIIQSFVSLTANRGIPGMLCTAWDDSSPHMDTYWRGFAAMGEYSWSPHIRSLDQFERAWYHRGFAPECADMSGLGLYAELTGALDFWAKGFYAKSGRRRPKELIDLPDVAGKGTWSKKYKEKLTRVKKEIERYKKTSAILESLSRKAHRNRYHIEILTATNDFQITTAKILLAVGDCDVKGSSQARANLQKELDNFEKAWSNLKTVYGKTRFIANPDSYLMDGNEKHIANQRPDLTWLIIPEETLMPELKKLLDR